jgi:hypothetical protein
MLHFSCDLCGRRLDEGRRYVAKVEVYPAFDPDEIEESDLDADNLEELAATIEAIEAGESSPANDSGPHDFRFDLCPHCHKRYLKDPLGRDALRRLNFSEN